MRRVRPLESSDTTTSAALGGISIIYAQSGHQIDCFAFDDAQRDAFFVVLESLSQMLRQRSSVIDEVDPKIRVVLPRTERLRKNSS
ncbi:hypothetical protein CV770_18945 [Bradyrhizobium sp. AC87j1]|nr:hypothetical protein CV770_18945 [Bradyrhizobium sp. AC87j1]